METGWRRWSRGAPLIAYAAGAGEFASDAVAGAANGLFTSKFLEALAVPGTGASDLFRRIRREVYAASNEQQRPAVYDDLDYEFVFRPARAAVTDTAAVSDALRQQETVFWASIRESLNPSDAEAFLAAFPNGTFAPLARNRLAALRAGASDPPSVETLRDALSAGPPRVLEPGTVFRDCDECPEMVVQPGGALALGRYEVTVGEYLAFASAAGAGAGDCAGGSWRDPGFAQTVRHPVACVSWHDAQAYASWLSRRTGADVSLADRGGVGVGGRRVPARVLRRSDGAQRNLPRRFLRRQRSGSVGHGREPVRMDGRLRGR